MSSDILGVSVSGLRVSQSALRTTGNNIANANTAGYSRQTVEINSITGSTSGSSQLGNGAYVANVERVVNDFVVSQTRQDTTLHSELEAYNDKILQLNDLLSNTSTGLSSGLESFFSATQNVSDDPTSIASRQLLVSETENLADRFNTLYSRLDTINEGVDQNIESAVNTVNDLIQNIASLNQSVAISSGSSGTNPPNDLLDQRDEALRELSELVSVQVSIQDDNQVNVAVGEGISLVLGFSATTVSLGQNEFNSLQPEIFLNGNAVSEPITDMFSSGEIGGLLDFRETAIDLVYNEIGRVGIVLADGFNEIQSQGITLNNTFGTNIFNDINDPDIASTRILPSANNADPSPQVGLSIIDPTRLTTSDYSLEINNENNVYTVTRLSDDTQLASGIMPVNFPTSITFDGLSFDITSGTFESGDSFLIQPTREGARDFSSQGLLPEDIALGSPVLTSSSLGNQGNANISAGSVLSLVDASGQPLPLFSQDGKMSPPLIVKFTSATTYDVLDNSNPGDPQQLEPPIRNQVYVTGINNNLFSENVGQTSIVSNGSALGLTTDVKANLQASGSSPSFPVTDFGGTANQFAFDVVVSNTVSGSNDGTFTVTIDSAGITDNATLLADINDDLSVSRVRAYITDAGGVGFLSLDDGAGDITLQNYNNDPDGTLDTAPIGQANTLLGFAIESSILTTVAGADGTSGVGTAGNDYPAETFTFTRVDPSTGLQSSQSVSSILNASARTTADVLSNISGVSANAFNYMELRDFSLSASEPLQMSLNGENLIEYEGAALATAVPDPSANGTEDFNDYLVERINSNESLSASGIYAVSAYDAINSEFYVQVHSTQGDDFSLALSASAGDTIDINDGVNDDVKLLGIGSTITSSTVVGGRMDITVDDNITLSSTPSTSAILGDSTASQFAQSTYLGIQAEISGTAQAGDTFTLDFNSDAALDNRNGLAMVALQQENSIDGGTESYDDAYNELIERVGIQASTSNSNTDAARNILEQSIEIRNSISGVNLDEEAADLIRYEQLYSANAQVISVARDIFDRLLNSV